jgi:hypothetical protein
MTMETKNPDRTEYTSAFCGDCDGCGWTEGGEAGRIGATCQKCKGTGLVEWARIGTPAQINHMEKP